MLDIRGPGGGREMGRKPKERATDGPTSSPLSALL